MSHGECALTGLEREAYRESKLEKAAEEICFSEWTSFVCVFAALQDGGLKER